MSAGLQAVLAVAAMAGVARTRLGRHPLVVALPPGLMFWPGPTAAAAALYLVVRRSIVLGRRRREALLAESQVVVVAELTSLGLSAGRNLTESLSIAGVAAGHPVQADVDRLLRRARLTGLSAAMAADDGGCARLSRLVATAVETGAPVRGALEAFVQDRSEGLVRARRLPVKLLFPLALLILPGFLALTVGPALLGSIDRLT